MEKCPICIDPIFHAGFRCRCNADLCLCCEAKLDQCPFCRRAYPPLLARAAFHGTTRTVLAAYLAPMLQALETEREQTEHSTQLFEFARNCSFNPFWFVAIMGFIQEIREYRTIVHLFEVELIELARGPNKPWECAAPHVWLFLRHYHWDAQMLAELYREITSMGETRSKRVWLKPRRLDQPRSNPRPATHRRPLFVPLRFLRPEAIVVVH